MTDNANKLQIWTIDQPYIEYRCKLGEGPYFEEATRTLRYVDIVENKLLRFHVDKGPSTLKVFDVEDCIGVTADIESSPDKILVAAKYGFATVNRSNGQEMKYVARAWSDEKPQDGGKSKAERMRFNDGAVEPGGRFIAGSMTDNRFGGKCNPEGALFRLAGGSEITQLKYPTPVEIPNGIGWSLDNRTMYFADSPTKKIRAFDYDASSGHIGEARDWFDLDEDEGGQEGVPDGFQVDANGDIWCAVYGVGKVIRLRDVDGKGEKIGEVRLPTKLTTCPRFVDQDLIITTASTEPVGSEEEQRGSGKVYRVNVGVSGRPPFLFSGSF